jgi:hypothetical protein
MGAVCDVEITIIIKTSVQNIGGKYPIFFVGTAEKGNITMPIVWNW